MAGLFKAALVVIGIIILVAIVSNVVRFLLSLLFPLLLVGLLAYLFYRLISRKCVGSSHHIFH